MTPNHGIPAAHIADVDLEAIPDRAVAAELARLGDLMVRGEDTDEDFCRLCQLLHDVGEAAKSEHLLRRNLADDDGTRELYFELFGTAKPDEFTAAIEAFKSQFAIRLTQVREDAFLVVTFQTDGAAESTGPALLTGPCELQFEYSERDHITCDLTVRDDDPERFKFRQDECLQMIFTDGVWTITDPLNPGQPPAEPD